MSTSTLRTSQAHRKQQVSEPRKFLLRPRALALLMMLGSLPLGGCFSPPPPSEPPPAVESESTDSPAPAKAAEAATDPAAEEAPPKPDSETAPPPASAGAEDAGAGQPPAASGASKNDKSGPPDRPSGMGRSQAAAGDFASSAAKEADSKLSLAESARIAAQMRAKARELQASNPGQAFEAALRGWQLTSRFPDDPACAAMHGEFGRMLDLLGTQANSGLGGSTPPLRANAETIIE